VILRRPPKQYGLRLLTIALSIPGLFRVPLPQADFHNIRHHDGAGEVCPYHDHLLRWHPTANQNDDVAVLHWHWFVPRSEARDPFGGSSNGPPDPGTGPSLHAYLANCLEPDWKRDPVIRPEGRGRFLQHPASGLSLINLAAESTPLTLAASRPSLAHASISSALVGLRAGLFGLHQRWNC
jgi:hypothetical protein